MSRAQPDVDRARDFVLRNARLLDRKRLAFVLGDDPGPAPVLDALYAYRNADGGFGNALEPDLRATSSQPHAAELALRVMAEVGHVDDEVATGLCDWLMTVTTPEGGVPFGLPSAEGEPHAPWWRVGPDPPANLNPTAAIAGLLHHLEVDHPWRETATGFCWRAIEAGGQPDEPHAFIATLLFLEHVRDRDRAGSALALVGRRLFEAGHVTLDPRAEGYVHRPLDLVPGPGSLGARLFDPASLDEELDVLASRQLEDGGWPITWEPPSEAAVYEWRGAVTVAALRTLGRWGRL